MSELPSGWVVCQLSDIGHIVTGKTPSTKEPRFYGGEIPFIKPGDLDHSGPVISTEVYLTDDGLAEVPALPPDSIVVTCIGNLGKVGITTKLSASNQQINAVVPDQGVDPTYIFHYCKTLKPWLESESSATTISIVNKSIFSTAPVPLPPLAEQICIAAKLDELLAQVDTLKARIDGIPALLKRFRQSILAAAVSGRLTEEWRDGNPYTESAEQQVAKVDASKAGKLKIRKTDSSFSADQLFEIPDGWGWIENHRLAKDSNTAICAGPFGTIFKAKDFRDTGVPIIFLRHVAEGTYKTEKPGFMDESVWKEFHQEYSVYGGELLITKLGDPPGTACLYPQGIGTAMVTPDVIKMSVDESVALPKYLMFFFNSRHCKSLIEKLAFGATRLRIDIAMFKGFPIPLPPFEEQTEIVHRVEQLFAFADQLEAKVASAKNRIDHLAQSILAKAFRGELVPQDPNDEPASVLLERIKAQRAAAPKAKRGRKASV